MIAADALIVQPLTSPEVEQKRSEHFEQASNIPIKQGWNVSAQLFYADDYAVITLNGRDVLDLGFGQPEKGRVDLQNLLQNGDNSLRVVCFNYHPNYWSFQYEIGIFDAAGKPAMPAIKLSPKGVTPHSGAQYDVVYTFTKT